MSQQEKFDGRPLSAVPMAYETATGNRIYSLPRGRLRGPIRGVVLALFALPALLFVRPALGSDCQKDVDELRRDIKAEKDRYTKNAVDEALDHLRKAEFHRVNPLECRQDMTRARAALTKGRKGGS